MWSRCACNTNTRRQKTEPATPSLPSSPFTPHFTPHFVLSSFTSPAASSALGRRRTRLRSPSHAAQFVRPHSVRQQAQRNAAHQQVSRNSLKSRSATACGLSSSVSAAACNMVRKSTREATRASIHQISTPLLVLLDLAAQKSSPMPRTVERRLSLPWPSSMPRQVKVKPSPSWNWPFGSFSASCSPCS